MTITDVKLFIQSAAGLDRDALHIHLALFLYLLAAVLLRRGRRSLVPWLFVLFVEGANEVRDYLNVAQARRDALLDECLKDLWNTMLWPTVLLILGRYTDFFARKAKEDGRREWHDVQLELPFEPSPEPSSADRLAAAAVDKAGKLAQ